jgi:hypothetical protein
MTANAFWCGMEMRARHYLTEHPEILPAHVVNAVQREPAGLWVLATAMGAADDKYQFLLVVALYTTCIELCLQGRGWIPY